MLIAVVLAAGDSRRMGTPKALLRDRAGRPFVDRIVSTLIAAGLDRIVIVTGTQHKAITDALEADAPGIAPVLVNNSDPSRGPLSSLWTAMDAVPLATVDGILMIPVDLPMTRPETVRAVIDAWRRTRAPIVRPAMGSRHGHPVLFDRSVFDELRRAPLAEGAKAVIHAFPDRVVNVAVDDDGCLSDIDTPADYEAMLRTKEAD